jgi:hypothetical protein
VVTTKFALDGWNPALATRTGNSNWNVLADLTSTGAVGTSPRCHGSRPPQWRPETALKDGKFCCS